MVEQDAVDCRRRVGLIGFSAMGRAVAGALRANEIDGATLVAVLVRELASYRVAVIKAIKNWAGNIVMGV
jgi:predicted homoserine dehydrogenase-like protein